MVEARPTCSTSASGGPTLKRSAIDTTDTEVLYSPECLMKEGGGFLRLTPKPQLFEKRLREHARWPS